MNGIWITDNTLPIKKGVSPTPLTYRKCFTIDRQLKRAEIQITAIGIYTISLNNTCVENIYFAPGFTSYRKALQAHTFDITNHLSGSNELVITVGAGWACGRLGRCGAHYYADRPALIASIRFEFEDGSEKEIPTDLTWQVTQSGNYKFADFYDGEVYDSTVTTEQFDWKLANEAKLCFKPSICAPYGPSVIAHEVLEPVSVSISPSGELLYDFGQNIAGVISADIQADSVKEIVFRHAEVLSNGELFTKSLRSAKATATYIASPGKQCYSPRLTSMGFRYVGVRGIDENNIQVKAIVLYSDIKTIGTFECSNADLTQLQSNIQWSGKSNFIEIPTDCPQRDERLGWTGDFAIYSNTACFNFQMEGFIEKWLKDLAYDQTKDGTVPIVVPFAGVRLPFYIPETGSMLKNEPVGMWSDSCIMVPWAAYNAYGNKQLLKNNYKVMKKHMKRVRLAVSCGSYQKEQKYIWNKGFQYGDWASTDGDMKTWIQRGPWVATAYYAHSCDLMSKIARELGFENDSRRYRHLFRKVSNAYMKYFTDGKGKLREEFQTGYILPLYFNMVHGPKKREMMKNLLRLVRENDYCVSAGIPSAHYLPFVLADNGYVEDAYKLLLQVKCPSWLYEVKQGSTTVWEIWNALNPDGTVNLGNLSKNDEAGMVSFNHYAYGAIGEFLYRRIAGIEINKAGYRSIEIKPIPGGDLTYAKAETLTPYGVLSVNWELHDNYFSLYIKVPETCSCMVLLPNGESYNVLGGNYTFSCRL